VPSQHLDSAMVSKLLVRASESDRLQELATNGGLTGRLTSRIAQRFIAGEHLSEATEVARTLNAEGRSVSLDLVGEKVRTDADADRAASDYDAVIAAMAAQQLTSGISIKPSQLGSGQDLDRTRQRLSGLAAAAGAAGLHLTLDMEDAATVDRTIDLVELLHGEGHRTSAARSRRRCIAPLTTSPG
jgi:proline dehydrogenase